jgi:hypothetical protein
MSGGDDETNTSSPGWHTKLSALNFLHLQVKTFVIELETKIK